MSATQLSLFLPLSSSGYRPVGQHVSGRHFRVIIAIGYIIVTVVLLRECVRYHQNTTRMKTSREGQLAGWNPPPVFTDFRLFNALTFEGGLESIIVLWQGSQLPVSRFLIERYGVDSAIGIPDSLTDREKLELAVQRHYALYFYDFVNVSSNHTVRRLFPLQVCDALHLDLRNMIDQEVSGDIGGAQGTVKITKFLYNGRAIKFLVKHFKRRDPPPPYKPRKGLNRIPMQREDGDNPRRNDGGAFYRELEAFKVLPSIPHFIAPVCYADHILVYPFLSAGDLVPLREDDDIFELIEPDLVFPRIAKQLITAVHQMHLVGITHMDIKPENILVGGFNRDARLSFFTDSRSPVPLVLIDYGLIVKEADFDGLGCIRAGTRSTMSPEQILCHRPLSPAADWWGVGATLWRLRVMWDPDMEDDERDRLLEAKDVYWQHPVIEKVDSFGPAFNELIAALLDPYPENRRFDEQMDKLWNLKFLVGY